MAMQVARSQWLSRGEGVTQAARQPGMSGKGDKVHLDRVPSALPAWV